MGYLIKKTEEVAIFCAFTFKNLEFYHKVLQKIIKNYGNVVLESELYNFSEVTKYYDKEMGSPLYKKIVGFERTMQLQGLHKIKIETNELEQEFSQKSMRTVNIDPGYITEAKVVLFSTKDFFHRIYLGDNIFGEITLYYKSKEGYKTFPWTFPDYKKDEVLIFFNEFRNWYRKILGRNRKKSLFLI
ncbi:MAG TPA: DUF4416 family protein [Spirochaetota bacterium]|nr:DUF4416 family protein [Spirochaetota bacterium]HOM37982.1 DUF4416 family protein [Spirochaetota bacterium]HPQ48787.1 DUF4416 family protein [Spirochaetota bacterium]